VTAMVTPFDDAGALDVDGAVTLARWLTAHGSDGLVVAGTTGEAPVLSDNELSELWRAVSEAVTVPVIAGTGTNDTRHTIECTKLAAAAGAGVCRRADVCRHRHDHAKDARRPDRRGLRPAGRLGQRPYFDRRAAASAAPLADPGDALMNASCRKT